LNVVYDWRAAARRKRLFAKASQRAMREMGDEALEDPLRFRRRVEKLFVRYVDDPHQL
jgi:hypothetical protein